jgi:cellulose synthase/poly-beta-1,6-N-acetylglucosamine synthase-like glycosyltransferase
MYILLIINSLYFILIIIFIVTWLKLMRTDLPVVSLKVTKLTIIIPVRDEQDNISNLLNDLNNQTYPYENFEVIIANDGSTDKTERIVLAFQEVARYDLKLLNILNENGQSPKKRAIQKSIEISSGELIMTTDGDCRVSENWLTSIENIYKHQDAKLISSGVTFMDEKSFWNTFQIIEFASLIGSGACSVYLKKPNMCNGANIAYTREVFEEVNGFSGNEHIASGDDEFLMHKISKLYPHKIIFNADKSAIVHSKSQIDFGHFYQQRKRWASKWKYYNDWKVMILALFIFTVNSGMIYAILTLSYVNLFLKCFPELLFLCLIIKYLGHKDKIKFIPFVQMIYPIYVVFFGVIAQGKNYMWKGRKLS